MRRLVLEVSEKEFPKLGVEIPPTNKIKSLEMLHILRQSRDEFAGIWRMELKDPAQGIGDMFTNGFLAEGQILEREKNGVYTVFMKVGPLLTSVLDSIGVVDGYLFPPLGIRDGKVKLSFLGSERQVRNFLEKLDEKGIKYKVVLLSDANFSPDSPLSKLTEKQREVLTAAYRFGYYDIPRRINSDDLAKKLGMVNSTLVEHIRKAEQRLLVDILTQKSGLWLDEEKKCGASP